MFVVVHKLAKINSARCTNVLIENNYLICLDWLLRCLSHPKAYCKILYGALWQRIIVATPVSTQVTTHCRYGIIADISWLLSPARDFHRLSYPTTGYGRCSRASPSTTSLLIRRY